MDFLAWSCSWRRFQSRCTSKRKIDQCEFGDHPWMYSNLPALTGSTIGFGSRPQEGKKLGAAAGDSPKSRSVQRGRDGHRFLRGGPQSGFGLPLWGIHNIPYIYIYAHFICTLYAPYVAIYPEYTIYTVYIHALRLITHIHYIYIHSIYNTIYTTTNHPPTPQGVRGTIRATHPHCWGDWGTGQHWTTFTHSTCSYIFLYAPMHICLYISVCFPCVLAAVRCWLCPSSRPRSSRTPFQHLGAGVILLDLKGLAPKIESGLWNII